MKPLSRKRHRQHQRSAARMKLEQDESWLEYSSWIADMNAKIKAASKAWNGVNADAWLEEVRGTK